MKCLDILLRTTVLALSVEGQSDWVVGQSVQTDSGLVLGHAAPDVSDVSEYLGIPYAVPPVGKLRWAPPQKLSAKNATINGTDFGFVCPTIIASLESFDSPFLRSANVTSAAIPILEAIAQFGQVIDEDCLTVNVWTKPQSGEKKKAVLFWIHGGGFQSGSSATPGYNGRFIANQEDVVFVSLNYRLGIFGFPGSPSATQNLGLRDQHAAIEWVRDNIASFGGDPERITIFGQSAGAASVDYHTFAWKEDPIPAGFIAQSGATVGPPQFPPNVTAASWYSVSRLLNCGNAISNSDEVLACMRSKDVASVLGALVNASTVEGFTGFGPTIDEEVVFSDYLKRGATGNLIKRPLLIGIDDFEAGSARFSAAIAGQVFPDAYWDAYNNNSFNCPAAVRANLSAANNIPTWRYRYFGEFPNTRLTSIPNSGAWHTSEVLVIFNTAPNGGNVPDNTPEEIAVGKYLRGAWAAFAKDPIKGLLTYEEGWPYWNPGENTLLRLAWENKTGPNLVLGTTYDTTCNATFIFPEDLVSTGVINATKTTGLASGPSFAVSSEGNRPAITPMLLIMAIGLACYYEHF